MEYDFVGKTLLLKLEGKKILAVGDLHLGYEEALNQSGVLVSRHLFKEMINEFDLIFEKAGDVDEVVLMGDVKHDFGEILKQEWADTIKLFDYLHEKCRRIVITRGNHDNFLLNISSKRDFVSVVDYYIVGDYCFLHGDRDFEEIHDKRVETWVIGHAHPMVELSDGTKSEEYKCFLVGKGEGKKVIIVPSFSEYSYGTDASRGLGNLAWDFRVGGFEVYVVGEGLEALSFGKLRNLK